MRAAFEAMEVWNVMCASSAVSTSCAWTSGADTRSSGSSGNTGVPSGTAQTSPVKRSSASVRSKNSAGTPRRFGSVRSHAISSGVK